MPVIDLKGITKRFNVGQENELTVLHGCDLAVDEGEFISIIGKSGSGKTTLMNIMGLMDRPDEGSYLLSGADVLDKTDDELAVLRRDSIGFVFQTSNLVGRVSALKNVEMPLVYAGMGRKERSERSLELLTLVGVENRAAHNPNELSGGQKQRVAIARALANNPTILLADEPTGALDTATGRSIMDLFHRLNRERGTTIVLITHNPELAAETSRIVTMVDGEIK